MCDAMDPDEVEVAVVNQILTSIIDGMRVDRPNDIRYAAIFALHNSLSFTENNFNTQVERDTIMRAICEATQCPDVRVRAEAFSCLGRIAELYYERLSPYVDTLFQLSTTAISTDDEQVGMNAVDFWTTISEGEIGILMDLADGASPEQVGVYLKIIEQAAKLLIPLLLNCMVKQSEDDDEDWNIAKAAGNCVEGIARIVRDNVVDLVLPFITQNINNANWRQKEAAVAVFGLILDGPSDAKLSPLIFQALPILLNCMKDPTKMVRHTTTWTIGQICQFHHKSISTDTLPGVVSALLENLSDPSAAVSSQACVTCFYLAEAYDDESEASSNMLSHFMPPMIQKLLQVSTRDDSEDENICKNAYEAVVKLVENSAADMRAVVTSLLTEALNRLELTFTATQLSSQLKSSLQCSLCTLISEIIKKLETNDVAPLADRVMQLLFQILNSNKTVVAREDAFATIGPVADKLEDKFVRYMAYLQPMIVAALKNLEEYQVCTIVVELIGDLCRAVSKQILTYSDEIMQCLLELLQSQVVNRSVKPHVISVFSDIAMAVEGDFERYCGVVLGILKQAGGVNIETEDEDLIEYINELRNSIMEAYTGILLVRATFIIH